MYTFIVRRSGTLELFPNSTDGGKQAYRPPYANDQDYRQVNNVDAILEERRNTRERRRARNHAEAWGY